MIVVVHHGLASVDSYMAFANKWNLGHSIIGIVPNRKIRVNNIQELGCYYADELYRRIGNKKCHLIGHSLGGQLVYEMAKRLYTINNEFSGSVAIVDKTPDNITNQSIPSLPTRRKDILQGYMDMQSETESIVHKLVLLNIDSILYLNRIANKKYLMKGHVPKLGVFMSKETVESHENTSVSFLDWQKFSKEKIWCCADLPGDHNTLMSEQYIDNFIGKYQEFLNSFKA